MLSIFCLLYNYLEISTPVLPTMILNEFFFIFADLTSLENHSNTDSHLNSNVDGKCERKKWKGKYETNQNHRYLWYTKCVWKVKSQWNVEKSFYLSRQWMFYKFSPFNMYQLDPT